MSPKRIKRDSVGQKIVVRTQGSTDNMCPVWKFDCLDRSGSFAFDLHRPDMTAEGYIGLFEKIIQYSNMQWSEIKKQTHDDRRSKHHFLEYDKLSAQAHERIQKLNLQEETDQIFSFAFDNTLRVIGIRRDEYFHAVWLDPEHHFCPSHKKHT